MAGQPHWPTPLVTATPRLDQDIKGDFVRQRGNSGYDTWNLGNSRGLDIVPLRRVQLSFNLPPFIDHTAPGQRDGFGDTTFTLRYRLLARSEETGNRILTAFLGASVPTGKNGNGSCCATLTPALGGGKGWSRVAVMSYAGASLPVSNAAGLGHAITWNTTAEYLPRRGGFVRSLTPQVESNTTFYVGGPRDGQTQSFVTPGLIAGRYPFLPHGKDPRSVRLGVALGIGEQIAVTHFHTYNHALVLAFRLPF